MQLSYYVSPSPFAPAFVPKNSVWTVIHMIIPYNCTAYLISADLRSLLPSFPATVVPLIVGCYGKTRAPGCTEHIHMHTLHTLTQNSPLLSKPEQWKTALAAFRSILSWKINDSVGKRHFLCKNHGSRLCE